MVFKNFWECNAPDFVNEIGTQFWLDKLSTKYAQNKNLNDISLNVNVFIVKEKNGNLTRIIVNDRGEVIFESNNLEAIGVHIDILKTDKHFG